MTDQKQYKQTYLLFIVGVFLTLIGSAITIVYNIKSDISLIQGKYDSLDVIKFKNSIDSASEEVQQNLIALSNELDEISSKIEKLNAEKKELLSSYINLKAEIDKITSFSKYIHENSSEIQIIELPDDMASFTSELSKLGLMSEIYGSTKLSIMVNDSSRGGWSSKSAEDSIRLDINSMTKSSLNKVGGQISYVPYDPAFIQNLMVTGYSDFPKKRIPNIVISGGVSENEILQDTKSNLINSISIDFTLLDFNTIAAIEKMTVTNKLKTHSSFSEGFLGITIFSEIFKNKGVIKKTLSIHDASRSLVELSIIQLIGRNLLIPYWKLFGESANQDNVVVEALEEKYFSMKKEKQIEMVQQFLFIHGLDVTLNGKLDQKTRLALNELGLKTNPSSDTISFEYFLKIYTTIPVNVKTLVRSKAIKNDLSRPF